jgi:hypothetical protein
MGWKDVFKTVGKLLIEKKLGEGENAAIATVVLGAILEKIHSKKDNPVVQVQPGPTPIPQPAGPPLPHPEVTPAQPPGHVYPEPDALEAHILAAEHWARGPHGGGLYGIGALQALRSGEGPAQPGDRIHMDVTPSARGVKFAPGGPENAVLLRPGIPEQEAAIMHHRIDGSCDLESEYDDGGCTPVLRVHRDFTGEETVTYQAEFTRKDGTVVRSNEVKFRIKG